MFCIQVRLVGDGTDDIAGLDAPATGGTGAQASGQATKGRRQRPFTQTQGQAQGQKENETLKPRQAGGLSARLHAFLMHDRLASFKAVNQTAGRS